MNWKNIIDELMNLGFTEQDIADDVSRKTGNRVMQSTIHKLKAGATKEPRHSLGEAVLAVHRERTRRAKRVKSLPEGRANSL